MTEFSRIIETSDVPEHGLYREVAASPDECRAVAERLGLVAIDGLSAELDVVRWSRGGFKVTGTLQAQLTQVCVVTLDEFSSNETVPVERTYVSPDTRAATAPDVVVDPLTDDEPDEIIDDRIDLGELLVETLALALEPYPRKPGAEFVAPADNADGAGASREDNPFSVLSKLNPSS